MSAESIVETVSKISEPQSPVVMTPENDVVVLPIGLVTPSGAYSRVRVRELNGYDEEAMARSKTFGMTLKIILDRAVVDIDGEKPTKSLMQEMFLGDRMAVLIGISRCTWGSTAMATLECPECGESSSVEYNLDDLEVTSANPEEAYFDVKLTKGNARVHWPKGDAHDAVLEMGNATAADLKTVLINTCVDEIRGMPVFGDAAKRLSMKDRATLVDAINSVYLGPRLDESHAPCPACGEEVKPALSLADLFPL